MAETSNIKNISQNVSQCRDGKPWKMTQTRMGWHTLHTHWQTRIGWHTLHTLPSRVCVWSVCHPILVCQCVWSVCHPILVWVIFHGLPSLHWLTFCEMFFMLLVVIVTGQAATIMLYSQNWSIQWCYSDHLWPHQASIQFKENARHSQINCF